MIGFTNGIQASESPEDNDLCEGTPPREVKGFAQVSQLVSGRELS